MPSALITRRVDVAAKQLNALFDFVENRARALPLSHHEFISFSRLIKTRRREGLMREEANTRCRAQTFVSHGVTGTQSTAARFFLIMTDANCDG